QWHAERVEDALSPYGIAAAVATHWLTADTRSFPEIPGEWSPSDGGITGTGLPQDVVATLGPGFQARVDRDGRVDVPYGTEIQIGELRIRPFVRVGDVALRVTSPSARARQRLIGLGTFPPDPSWVVPGTFTPAESEQFNTFQTDGTVVGRPLAGRIGFDHGGSEYLLLATAVPRGLFVTFSDATSAVETAPFRFLTIDPPDADGSVTLDFNRAYLPPASFDPSYSCPLPPRQNRLPFPVRAGETVQLYALQDRT
ncbi:MAG: DUF1684 domain-containing protein, partial [Propionibacteriaceae bacterium]|nr:DUF1684 domain-containing protein [Propionibacteriaceae bacterium]